MMLDTLTGRSLPFYNQEASLNATPSFTPDGKQIYYASTAARPRSDLRLRTGRTGFPPCLPSRCDRGGTESESEEPGLAALRQRTGTRADLSDERRRRRECRALPTARAKRRIPRGIRMGSTSRSPGPAAIAKGDFNIFVMDIGSRQYVQLTHGEGRNENPSWAPDGRHLVFASTRTAGSRRFIQCWPTVRR